MRYFIGCLIRGEAKDYQERLIDRICKRFDIRNLNKHIPAHFTLKAPFESDDIGEVEELLSRVCGEGEVSSIEIDEIGNFHKRVIFLRGRPSSGVVEFLGRLNDGLRKIEWMKFEKHDLNEGNLHSTLARVRDVKQFDDIMRFLASERPCFKFGFDNVVIFRKRGNVWEVYREFGLR
jgi:2'-5' RNA ligase